MRARAAIGRCIAVLCGLALALPCLAQSPLPLGAPNVRIVVNGDVNAIAAAPDGSLIIGGTFTSVNDQGRGYLARILPNGSLDPGWNPNANGEVYALALDATGNVFVGGSFSVIGARPRTGLAKVLASATGSVDASWNPALVDPYGNPGGSYVRAVTVDSAGAVYAGGWFTKVNAQTRKFVAKLSASGAGVLDSAWHPDADGEVRVLRTDAAGSIYVAGGFQNIGGQPRRYLAKLTTSAGVPDAAWNPSPNDVVNALDLSGSAVYIAGSFGTVGGQSRKHIARLSAGDGAADATWNPSSDLYHADAIVAGTQNDVYVAGGFEYVGGLARNGLAKLSAAGSGSADASWNPAANAANSDYVHVLALSASGQVLAGGAFRSLGGQPRWGIAALDAGGNATGSEIDVEVPGVVYAVAAQANGGVIVGGDFLRAGGVVHNSLLRLLPDGTLDPAWTPSADAPVYSVSAGAGDVVYVAGNFFHMNGQAIFSLARLTGTAGALDAAWQPAPSCSVVSVAADTSGAVFAGGCFSTIGGASRSRIAKLNGSGNGSADATWDASANPTNRFGYNTSVGQLALDGNGHLYAAGDFVSMSGAAHIGLAKLPTTGNGAAEAAWNPAFTRGGYPDSLVRAIAVDPSGAVFAGGFFDAVNGTARIGLAKITAGGSLDPTWNPGASYAYVDALALDATAPALYAGGTFSLLGGQPRSNLARLATGGTGNADPQWNPGADAPVNGMVLAGSNRLIVGGTFYAVAGRPRAALAALPADSDRLFQDGFEGL